MSEMGRGPTVNACSHIKKRPLLSIDETTVRAKKSINDIEYSWQCNPDISVTQHVPDTAPPNKICRLVAGEAYLSRELRTEVLKPILNLTPIPCGLDHITSPMT